MQKKIFFYVFFSFALLQLSRAQDPLYMRLRSIPVLAYGTISDFQADEEHGGKTAILTIEQVFKGGIKAKKLPVVFENESGGTALRYQIDIQEGDKKVFFLKRDNEQKWRIDTRELPYSLNVGDDDKIYLTDERLVTFDDFRKGFFLFNTHFNLLTKKYEENNPKIKVENPTKNRTFAFLMAELRTHIAKLKKIIPVAEPAMETVQD
ncbi:MAG: hypothetical protein RI894_1413 [Bacteroidota bacterium]|jgi:hypothetical protein